SASVQISARRKPACRAVSNAFTVGLNLVAISIINDLPGCFRDAYYSGAPRRSQWGFVAATVLPAPARRVLYFRRGFGGREGEAMLGRGVGLFELVQRCQVSPEVFRFDMRKSAREAIDQTLWLRRAGLFCAACRPRGLTPPRP